MKSIITLFLFTCLGLSFAFGQDKSISSGEVLFHAIENRNFTAISTTVKSNLSFTANSVSFIIPTKSFKFKNAEMQTKFNQKENLNSETYPNILFNGELLANSNISENGRHIVTLKGELTIKGITHKLETKGLLVNKSGQTTLKASFLIDGKKYGLNSVTYKDFIEQLEFSIELVY